MYDYVLQLGFEKQVQNSIQKLKQYLKDNNVKDIEKSWLPHITIDLYNCKNQEEFIQNVDNIAKYIKSFKLKFKNLNNFENETLYIEPYDKTKLKEIKSFFDIGLNKYMIEKRKSRIYMPHVTLCTNDDVENAEILANEKFNAFEAEIKYLWVYRQNMELVKQYKL